MARTKGTPGPKPQYGEREDFHILLSKGIVEGEAMPLAKAFKTVAKQHGGVIAYVTKIIRERPEILALLEQKQGEHD